MIGRQSVSLGTAIAVAIALASCASPPTPSPAQPATSGPTSSAPAPTPASAAPTTSESTGTWTLEASLSSFRVAGLVSLDGRIVAAGCVLATGICVGAAIGVLDSGQWSASTLDGDPARLELSAVDAGDAGLIVVGRAGDLADPATWRAAALVSMDGQAWRAAPNQGSFQGRVMVDVAELPGEGWVAVGTTVTPSTFVGFETWLSRDGLAWELVASMEPNAVVGGVAAFAGGMIAWGTDCLDVCGHPTRAILWTSGDGRTWTRVPEQLSLANAVVDSVIPTSGGALAVGSVYDQDALGRGAVWVTTDGSSWEQALLPGAAGHQSYRVVEAADGIVVIGAMNIGNGSTWRAWHAPDGMSWSPVPGSDVAAEGMELVSVSADVLAVAIQPTTDRGSSYLLRLRIE